MWRCPACGESVGDGFDACWKCKEPKPALPVELNGNFQETKQPDGTVTVRVFGQGLNCAVCGNQTFHERSTLLSTALLTFFKLDWANESAMNFICSRCGYIFWFLPPN